jgi:hypothetical protein
LIYQEIADASTIVGEIYPSPHRCTVPVRNPPAETREILLDRFVPLPIVLVHSMNIEEA